MGRLLSCMRKKRFATKTEAIDAGTRALRDRSRGTTYIRFYLCNHCHGFHLTSTRPRFGATAAQQDDDGRDR